MTRHQLQSRTHSCHSHSHCHSTEYSFIIDTTTIHQLYTIYTITILYILYYTLDYSLPINIQTLILDIEPKLPNMPSSVSMIDKPRYKGILWDVDGTLSNSFQLAFASTLEVLKKHNKGPISEEEYHRGTIYTAQRRLAWHITGNPDDEQGIMLGQEFDDLFVSLTSAKTVPLYDGIKSLLMDLNSFNNVKIGALSNACGAYVRNVISSHKLESVFSIGLGADDVTKTKPNPDGLLYICKHLQLDVEDCVYIGDSPTDGLAARNCGMKSIGVSWGSHNKELLTSNFDIVVDTTDDLSSKIKLFLSL